MELPMGSCVQCAHYRRVLRKVKGLLLALRDTDVTGLEPEEEERVYAKIAEQINDACAVVEEEVPE